MQHADTYSKLQTNFHISVCQNKNTHKNIFDPIQQNFQKEIDMKTSDEKYKFIN